MEKPSNAYIYGQTNQAGFQSDGGQAQQMVQQPYQQNQQPYTAQPVQQPYGQMEIQQAQVKVIAIAPVANQMVVLPKFTLDPTPILCPYCGKSGTTVTETSFNCASCCCWYTFNILLVFSCYTGLLPWICFQACRGKNISCMDAIHKCPSCGQTVGSYSAC